MAYPVHEHRLQLTYKGEGEGEGEGDGAVKCRACGEPLSGQICWCDLCKFCFHESCANLPLKIKTFFHPCPLTLLVSRSFICNSCFEGVSKVFAYRCGRCDFDMDVGCALQALSIAASKGEREQILHCCHRHPLQLLSFETQMNSTCRICNTLCSSEPTWGCQPCNFCLHKSCLDFLPQITRTHLDSKVASWVLLTNPSRILCFECVQPIDSHLVFRKSGSLGVHKYLCISCCLVRKTIEDLCLEVPKFINHFFHLCPLRLVFSPFSICNICSLNSQNHQISYHCKPCDFFLHLDCAQLHIISHREETNQIRHFCHWHPLELFPRATTKNTLCNSCDSSCSEFFYGCTQCEFYIHKSCMDILPQNVIYPLLNQTFVLLPTNSFNCTTCNRVYSGLNFCCTKSQYKFCVTCILRPDENEFGDTRRFKSIHHWHQLTSGHIDKAYCFMCEDYCSGSTYHCKECNIFFHKSCAELPRQFQQHPIHPHPLTLALNFGGKQVKCKLCLKALPTRYNGFYQCVQCNFHLDTRCASLLPSIEYEGHPHILYVVENLYNHQYCHLCKSSCKGSPSLRCVKCDFISLHLLCGPLPCTIKHASHVHPLALQDYYVENNASDEFACHICEERRDPRQRIYRCVEGCLMICEVKCVLFELVASLRGEHGVIELETMYQKLECKVITRDSVFEEIAHANKKEKDENLTINKDVFFFNQLIQSIEPNSEHEGEETYGAEASERTENPIKFTSNRENEYDNLAAEISIFHKDEPLYSYSQKAFDYFIKQLDQGTWDDKEDIFRQHDGSSMTGAYLLPEALNLVYEDFFGKYALDLAWCKLDYNRRRCIVFMICSILHEMHMNKVVDVPREKIHHWLNILKVIRDKVGKVLKLDFLIEHVRRIGRAHFIVQAKHIVDTKSSKLRKENEELSALLEELIRKQKETEMKLQANEKERKEHSAYRAAGASQLKREYYDALEFKWRPCYEFSEDYSGRA